MIIDLYKIYFDSIFIQAYLQLLSNLPKVAHSNHNFVI